MIRLGHIDYSNCFPVHSLIVTAEPPPQIRIVRGTPAQLNRALADGDIDVAPASSIEFARNGGAYRVLPHFLIGSDGPVQSILLESTRPLAELAGAIVAVPTASATSVVLLKILLHKQYAIEPRFQWYDQNGADPVNDGASAALWIGDVALRRPQPSERLRYDLGAEWTLWTGLPFVYALWQTRLPEERNAELQELLRTLQSSHAYFNANAAALARLHASRFGLPAERLKDYWRSIRYTFDERMHRGLLRFYALAAELNEAPPVSELRWVDVPAGVQAAGPGRGPAV